MKRAFAVLFFVVLAGTAFANQAAAPAPKLTDSVKLKIVQMQLQQSKLEGEYVQLQSRIDQIRTQHDQNQVNLLGLYATALKDSGIDPKKFRLITETLEVVPQPAEDPGAVVVGKEAKKP